MIDSSTCRRVDAVGTDSGANRMRFGGGAARGVLAQRWCMVSHISMIDVSATMSSDHSVRATATVYGDSGCRLLVAFWSVVVFMLALVSLCAT